MKHIPLPADQIFGNKNISGMFLASNYGIKPKSPREIVVGARAKTPFRERIQAACRLAVVMVWHTPKPGRQGSVGTMSP